MTYSLMSMLAVSANLVMLVIAGISANLVLLDIEFLVIILGQVVFDNRHITPTSVSLSF